MFKKKNDEQHNMGSLPEEFLKSEEFRKKTVCGKMNTLKYALAYMADRAIV